MLTFLAPVPIVHVQSMLDGIKLGQKRIAFGSGSQDFFNKHGIENNCEEKNIAAYIYVSQTGVSNLKAGEDKELGVRIKGRLCGWCWVDERGKYPKTGLAYRPLSTKNDSKMAIFWEIDMIESLERRLPMSAFISAATKKKYGDDYVPQGPISVIEDM